MNIEPAEAPATESLGRYPALPYVAPFLAFLAFLAVDRFLPFGAEWNYAIRFAVIFGLLIWLSRRVIPWRISSFAGSAVLGAVVFAIWVGPDLLWPGYRQSWLFNNSIVGAPQSSLPAGVKTSATFILFRLLSSVVNVPILEELFWRGWLMRWLPSRAHDNGTFLVFANGVGVDDDEIRTGNAMILDPYGRILAETAAVGDAMVVADLDGGLLQQATGREWIAARRPELYGLLTKRTGLERDTHELKFEE